MGLWSILALDYHNEAVLLSLPINLLGVSRTFPSRLSRFRHTRAFFVIPVSGICLSKAALSKSLSFAMLIALLSPFIKKFQQDPKRGIML